MFITLFVALRAPSSQAPRPITILRHSNSRTGRTSRRISPRPVRRTPYDEPTQRKPLRQRIGGAPPCPQCGSNQTYRDYNAEWELSQRKESWKGCALDSCLMGCDLILWPVLLPLLIWELITHVVVKSRRNCTCHACGHTFRSIK